MMNSLVIVRLLMTFNKFESEVVRTLFSETWDRLFMDRSLRIIGCVAVLLPTKAHELSTSVELRFIVMHHVRAAPSLNNEFFKINSALKFTLQLSSSDTETL
jgi:hypothetical protein